METANTAEFCCIPLGEEYPCKVVSPSTSEISLSCTTDSDDNASMAEAEDDCSGSAEDRAPTEVVRMVEVSDVGEAEATVGVISEEAVAT